MEIGGREKEEGRSERSRRQIKSCKSFSRLFFTLSQTLNLFHSLVAFSVSYILVYCMRRMEDKYTPTCMLGQGQEGSGGGGGGGN